MPAVAGQNRLVRDHDEYPSLVDTRIFMTEFRSDVNDAGFVVQPDNGGGCDPTNADVEANLNVEYAMSISSPTLIIYSVGKREDDEMIPWLHYMLNENNIPQTIITPYGDFEDMVLVNIHQARASYSRDSACAGSARGTARSETTTARSTFSSTHASLKTVRMALFLQAVHACVHVDRIATPSQGHCCRRCATTRGAGEPLRRWLLDPLPRPDYQDNAVKVFLENLGDTYDGLYECVCIRHQ